MAGEASDDDVRRRWRAIDWTLLAIVCAIALGIRLNNVDAAPSVDELWHLALSTGNGSPMYRYESDRVYAAVPQVTTLRDAEPAWRIWTGLDGVLHPPAYVLTLRLWRDAFGESDRVAQAYSIAWSIVAIGFAFAAAREAMDRPAAAIVAMILAVAPVQVYFAQEVRGYSMLIGEASIAIWLATRIEVRGVTPRRAAGLAAMTLPLMLTHYFAAGACVGVATYGLLRFRGRARMAFAIALVASAILYAIAWGPFAYRQIGAVSTGDAFAKVEHTSLADEAWWLVPSPARLMVEGFWLLSTRQAWPAVVIGGACLVLPWCFIRRLRPLLPWAAMLAGSTLAIGALDLARTTWLGQLIRYLATPSAAVPLIVVGVPSAIRRRAGHVVGVAAIVALVAIPRGRSATIADSPGLGGMAAYASANARPGEAMLIYAADPRASHLIDFMVLTLAHEPTLFPRTVAKLTRAPSDAMRAALPDVGWVFFPGVAHVPESPILLGFALRSAAYVPGEGVVARYDLRAPSTRSSRDDHGVGRVVAFAPTAAANAASGSARSP